MIHIDVSMPWWVAVIITVLLLGAEIYMDGRRLVSERLDRRGPTD